MVLAGDENGLNQKWRKGYVFYEGSQILTDRVRRNTTPIIKVLFRTFILHHIGYISLILCQIYCEAQGSSISLYAWPTDGDETRHT